MAHGIWQITAFNTPAFNDNVVDTMGAGDAFSISSLIMKINKDGISLFSR